jgi:hypothetical protein
MTMKQAAEEILRAADGPLRADEITDRALDAKMIRSGGKTPRATMQAQLAVAAKKGERFVRTDPGVYGLRDRDR